MLDLWVRCYYCSGNTDERVAAELPGAEPQPMVNPERRPLSRLEDQLLHTSAPALSTIQIEPAPEPELLLSQQEVLLAGGDTLLLRGDTQQQLYLSPDTRASRLAPYLDAWRRRVEQVGTVNFPALARQQGLAGEATEAYQRFDPAAEPEEEQENGSGQRGEAGEHVTGLLIDSIRKVFLELLSAVTTLGAGVA